MIIKCCEKKEPKIKGYCLTSLKAAAANLTSKVKVCKKVSFVHFRRTKSGKETKNLTIVIDAININ